MRRTLFALGVLVISAFAGLAQAAPNPFPDPWPPHAPLPPPAPPGNHGGAAPAPEMGASILGVAMVGALAFYVVWRRREARA